VQLLLVHRQGFWNDTGSASDCVFGPDISVVVTAAPAPPTAVTTPPTSVTPPPGHTTPPTASSPTTSHGGVSLAWLWWALIGPGFLLALLGLIL